jgi:serine/threonine protein kinase
MLQIPQSCRLCDGGTLLEYLRRVANGGNVLLEQHSALIMLQLLRAVAVCHQNGIMHRDIKLENIVFSSHGASAETLRLADFGSAELFRVGDIKRAWVRVGTERYMAPEVFKGSYGPESDVFSCGVVMHLLLTQRV